MNKSFKASLIIPFAALHLGIVSTIYIGALSKEEYANIPSWIQAFAAIYALAISAVGIWFLYHTLAATLETLSITQATAVDQRNFSHAQTRPWIGLEVFSSGRTYNNTHAAILSFKNYGQFPAQFLALTVSATFESSTTFYEAKIIHKQYKRHLAPNQTADPVYVPLHFMSKYLTKEATLHIELRYSGIHHSQPIDPYENDLEVSTKDDGSISVEEAFTWT